MNIVIGLIVILMVGGIVFLTKQTSDSGNKREHFLDAFASYVEGKISSFEQFDNSYRITFKYKGREFTFDDIEDKGFQNEVIYHGYLRLSLGSDLIISFTEKPLSFLLGQQKQSDNVHLPKALKDFTLYSNKPNIANRIFEDEEIVRIFAKYKNIDSRGHPVISLDIKSGVVSLKFNFFGNLTPSLLDLKHNISSIDDHLDRLIVLANKIELIRKQEEE